MQLQCGKCVKKQNINNKGKMHIYKTYIIHAKRIKYTQNNNVQKIRVLDLTGLNMSFSLRLT
jgi:hypothetical protein